MSEITVTVEERWTGAFEEGMQSLYEALGQLEMARYDFERLPADDPARWVAVECYKRWLDLRRFLTKIEDGKLPIR